MVLPVVTTFDEARQVIRDQAEKIEKLSNELSPDVRFQNGALYSGG